MEIKLYNTLTRKKEVFKPIKKSEVGIYTCGPTVYWYQHIGNLRSYIFSDFKQDLNKLNIEPPNEWTKATDHIKEQIDLIKKLEKKGFTYKTKDGIYMDTSKVKNYGKLAKLKIKDLKAGKRTKMMEKKNKTDFALWKFSNKNE